LILETFDLNPVDLRELGRFVYRPGAESFG